jgi:hypothetical protein
MLSQLPRKSRHVSRLPCKYLPIFLDEFDEHKFLFRIQTIVHKSNLGGSSGDSGIILLSESSNWMDILDVLASDMIGSGWDSTNAFFNSWNSVDTISMLVISQLSLSQS